MNSISYNTEVHEEIVVEEIPDDEGNIEVVESTVYVTTLYINVSHKTAEEMALQYGFTAEQLEMLHQLLDDGNDSMWGAVLYGIHTADEQIVAVAEAQIGNIGGPPYWSWYGYSSRVAWCAIFVSWCANECGYIMTVSFLSLLGVITASIGLRNAINGWMVMKHPYPV